MRRQVRFAGPMTDMIGRVGAAPIRVDYRAFRGIPA
jgi:hypothetical protein